MRIMPTLHDVQKAMHGHVLRSEAGIAAMLDGETVQERLDVYRNTVILTLTRALRIAFPAVHKLVGEAFFETAAGIFFADHPPRAACLDLYGEEFPRFLADFEPARNLAYLSEVARLEWAVNRALHAPNGSAIDLDALGAMSEADIAVLRLTPDPSVTWLEVSAPADAIWRAVLDGDDDTLAAIEPFEGPVHLLIERGSSGVAVQRLDEHAWRFGSRLSLGEALGEVIAAMPGFDTISALAAHLAAGRFISFRLSRVQPAHASRITDD
jgi:hypothetical protein